MSVGSVFAANHYITVNGSGSKNGSDWNNAAAGSPSSFIRGDTYYFAAGTNAPLNLNTPASGTNVIKLKAATVADHGTNTGWASSLAGQTVFLQESSINSPYWIIDGQTRGSDWRSGYGLKFWNQTNEVSGACIHLNAGANNITIRYCDIQGTSNIQGTGSTDGDTGLENSAQIQNLYVGYCYVHETGNTQFQINYGNSDGFICEYNYIYKNHTAWNANHDEAFSLTFSNSIIRFNIMQDIVSSGIICDAAGGTPSISNWEVYGNVFFWSTNYQRNTGTFLGNGVMGFFGETYYGHFYFYNNTIVGITNRATQISVYQGGLNVPPGSGSQTIIENNLWYDCQQVSGFPGAGNVCDYNSYFGPLSNNSSDNGSHKQTSSALNQLVNPYGANPLGSSDFHLVAATALGVALPAPYNTDIAGNLRGADGVWDRGAYEYNGAPNTNPPVISAIQATSILSSSATVVWTTDQPATSLIQYGLTTGYGNTLSNGTLVTSHSLGITGLNASATYHYQVKSANSGGYNSSSSDFTFTTPALDTNPPNVSVMAPGAGTLVAGATTLSASASDGNGVSGVQFLVDGQTVGPQISGPPYTYNWASSSVSNGNHSIQARAWDSLGNNALSTAVGIAVQNMVTNGLVGYWTFDEGVGTQAGDSSGNSGTATLATGASWTSGIVGSSALLLDGANGSATVPDSAPLEVSTNLTVALWVRHNALPAVNSWMYYLDKGAASTENYGVGAYTDVGGTHVFFELIDSTATYRYYTQGSGPVINTDLWTHVVVVLDHAHSQLAYYINGQPIITNSVSASLQPTTDPLLIGQQNIPGYTFPMNGNLDDLRIYNRALSAAEVKTLFTLGRLLPPGFVPPTIKLSSPPRAGTNASVTLNSVTGLVYTLQYKGSLTTTNWTVLLPSVIGTGNPITLRDTNASWQPSRFYNVNCSTY